MDLGESKMMEMAGPSITQKEIDIVTDAMKNGWYGEGKYKYCELFQNEFSKYHDREFGIMTPSCTTAIHLLLTAMGIKEGDEVIVPECTWIASVAGIVYLKAKPIFCDIEIDTWCLCPESVRRSITPRTKAILTVNVYGNMSDMHSLKEISEQYNIPLIEDAAESIGSSYHGIKSGKFGIGSVFSFHRTKTLTTGEGGMLLLDDPTLYDRCMFLRDHGRAPGRTYYNTEVTYKYMPFNLQAALGYAQFQRIDELIKIKRDQFHFYRNELLCPELKFNFETEDITNGAWITAVLFDRCYGDKHEIISKLLRKGVPVRPFFYPLSSLPAFNEFNKYQNKNKVAYDVCSRGVNLPGAANLTEDDMLKVVKGIKELMYEG